MLRLSFTYTLLSNPPTPPPPLTYSERAARPIVLRRCPVLPVRRDPAADGGDARVHTAGAHRLPRDHGRLGHWRHPQRILQHGRR
jgi:hypothetical protein